MNKTIAKSIDIMYRIGQSQIHGRGVIATRPMQAHQPIDMAIEYQLGFLPFVTYHFGSYINHSSTPNTYLRYVEQPAGYAVVTSKPIHQGEELTINYDQCPWYVMGSLPWYK